MASRKVIASYGNYQQYHINLLLLYLQALSRIASSLMGLSNHVSTDTFTYFVACAASGFESGHPPPRRYCTALPRTPLTHTVQFAAQHLQAAMQQQLSCNCQFCIEPTLLHDSDVNCVLLKVNVNSVSCQTDAGGKSTVNATLSRLKWDSLKCSFKTGWEPVASQRRIHASHSFP